jgi:hypothetical protein
MKPHFLAWFRLAVLVCTLSFSSTSFAANIRFCLNWHYSFTDQNFGEDHLRHNSGSSYGRIPASYAYAEVQKQNGGPFLFNSFLNSSGCTNPVPQQAGYYYLRLHTRMNKNGSAFEVRQTVGDTSHVLFLTNYNLAATQSTDMTVNLNVGFLGDALSNSCAVATQVLREGDIGLTPNPTPILIYSYNPSSSIGATSGFTIKLGVGRAWYKYVIAHEIGHAIHKGLMGGTFAKNYDGSNPGEAVCKCDHIPDPASRPHCLQSREEGGVAQNEGFAHLVALDAMNYDGESDASFVYYKNFLHPHDTGDPDGQPPPIQFNGRLARKWMETHCNLSTPYRGVEMDWMGFYYAVHSTTSNWYTFAQIKDVYTQTCGGSCDQATPHWLDEVAAANALHGANTPKADHWINRGVDFGVDH